MALQRKPNEAELLERIARGEELAFSELFYAYYNQVSEFVQLLTHSEVITAEIVQDVFTKIWVDRASLVTIRRFDAYLFVLTRNHTLNHIRRVAAERKRKDEYIRHVEADLNSRETEREAYFQLIDRAVQLLPPQQQKVFALRRRGIKNPEIAQQMQLSIESVKKYQHLAMKFIVEFVKGHALIAILYSHSHSNWFS